jgi:2-dehydropantoate 2-reductase
MRKDQLKIAIVGGGNVGRFLSTMLMSLGYDVELVCRDNHRTIRIDNSYAFEIKGDFGDKSYLVPFVTSIDQLSTKKDIIIFATKSFDMLDRVSECLNKLTPKGLIATIQNVFSIDKLYNLIPPESSVCMICDFACKTIDKTTYIKDTQGIVLGAYHPNAINRMKLLRDVLDDFIRVTTVKDIVGFSMGRNIINGAISLLGGISGLNLKYLLSSHKGRHLFLKIIEESCDVCAQYKINVLPYNEQLDYKKFVSKSINGKVYRRKIFKVLRKQNGHIKSSALDNLEHGERTEIRCLLDSIIKYAEHTSTPIPTIRVMDEILKCLEEHKLNINKNNISIIYSSLKAHKKCCCKDNIEDVVEDILEDCIDD